MRFLGILHGVQTIDFYLLRLVWGGQASFSLPKHKGHLNVTLQHGSRKIDKHPILILQLTATGLGADKSMNAVWVWFEVAHEWIVCGFTDLTGATIQKDIWQRTDVI